MSLAATACLFMPAHSTDWWLASATNPIYANARKSKKDVPAGLMTQCQDNRDPRESGWSTRAGQVVRAPNDQISEDACKSAAAQSN
jgi:hypothetical protein